MYLFDYAIVLIRTLRQICFVFQQKPKEIATNSNCIDFLMDGCQFELYAFLSTMNILELGFIYVVIPKSEISTNQTQVI